MAGIGSRSSRYLPVNSAATWWASAALPPLPNSTSVPPASSLAATSAAHASSAAASSVVASADAISACSCSRRSARSTIVHAPRRQSVRLERELRDGSAEPRQRLCHAVLLLELAVEEHVAAPARTRHLAAQRTGPARLGICRIDELRADLGRHPLLLPPRLVQKVAELPWPPAHQRVLHLDRQLLLAAERRQRPRLPALVARRLILDHAVRPPRRARVA